MHISSRRSCCLTYSLSQNAVDQQRECAAKDAALSGLLAEVTATSVDRRSMDGLVAQQVKAAGSREQCMGFISHRAHGSCLWRCPCLLLSPSLSHCTLSALFRSRSCTTESGGWKSACRPPWPERRFCKASWRQVVQRRARKALRWRLSWVQHELGLVNGWLSGAAQSPCTPAALVPDSTTHNMFSLPSLFNDNPRLCNK
jgi:hypothetical protein